MTGSGGDRELRLLEGLRHEPAHLDVGVVGVEQLAEERRREERGADASSTTVSQQTAREVVRRTTASSAASCSSAALLQPLKKADGRTREFGARHALRLSLTAAKAESQASVIVARVEYLQPARRVLVKPRVNSPS